MELNVKGIATMPGALRISDSPCRRSQARSVAPLTANRERVRLALDSLATSSGSRLDAGLSEGRLALGSARPAERKILVMLTDGRPSQVEAEAG